MLRAVLLGVLTLSTAACKSKTDSAASSQPGVAAGKVVEVKGTVNVKHADATVPLVSGATVEGDDTVITGADGNVVIELAHNAARWELGPNKTQKVRDSIAWKAQKNTGSAAEVEHDTAAAGRPAERNAAGTVAMADEPAAAAPAPAAAAPAAAPAAMEEPDMMPKGGEAAPPPRAPSRRRVAAAPKEDAAPAPSRAAAPMEEASLSSADDEAPPPRRTRGPTKKESADAPPPPPPSPADAAALVGAKAGALKQCLVASNAIDELTIVVNVRDGKAQTAFKSKAALGAELQACINKVINGISFTGTATVTRTIKP